MLFKFKNMGQYVRNVVDPLVKASNLFFDSRVRVLQEKCGRDIQNLRDELESKLKKETEAMNDLLTSTLAEQQKKIDSFPVIQVGTIVIWPFPRDPSDMANYLECNGQAITPVKYPELYALVGDHVPDLRGLFLRGYGSRSFSGRTISSASLNTVQADGVRIQQGDIKIKSGDRFLYRWYQSFSGASANEDYTAAFGTYMRKNGQPVTAIEVGNLGSNEDTTRPVNMAVRYLMRAKP